MGVTETILQSFIFAPCFDSTKIIQLYEIAKLFCLKNVNWFQCTPRLL